MKKLYYVYDSVEEVNIGYFECQSLDVLLRNNGKVFAQMSPHYVDDWRFYCIGNSPKPDGDSLNLDFIYGTLEPIDIKSSALVERPSTPMEAEEIEKLKLEK